MPFPGGIGRTGQFICFRVGNDRRAIADRTDRYFYVFAESNSVYRAVGHAEVGGGARVGRRCAGYNRLSDDHGCRGLGWKPDNPAGVGFTGIVFMEDVEDQE